MWQWQLWRAVFLVFIARVYPGHGKEINNSSLREQTITTPTTDDSNNITQGPFILQLTPQQTLEFLALTSEKHFVSNSLCRECFAHAPPAKTCM